MAALSYALQERQCIGCGRKFKTLPTSQTLVCSRDCAIINQNKINKLNRKNASA